MVTEVVDLKTAVRPSLENDVDEDRDDEALPPDEIVFDDDTVAVLDVMDVIDDWLDPARAAAPVKVTDPATTADINTRFMSVVPPFHMFWLC